MQLKCLTVTWLVIVEGTTGEAKEVDAITVMNVIDYPTPLTDMTHFNEEYKACLLK